MMVDKKGKVCRNIQEQVGKNTCDIAELKKASPNTDFVMNATKSEDERTLHITQKVDGQVMSFDFKGGDNLIAGTNVDITDTEEGKVISATTEPVGSVSFANIAGSPNDNTLLANELTNRFKLQFSGAGGNATNGWVRIENQSGLQIRAVLSNQYTWYLYDSIRYYPDRAQTQRYFDLDFPEVSGTIAVTSQIPTKTSDITNDSGFVTGAGGAITNVSSIKLGLGENYDRYQSGGVFHHYNGTSYLLTLPDTNGILAVRNDLLPYQKKLTAGTGITIDQNNVISATGGGGTGDYEDLDNKPQIEGVELIGNKSASALGLATATSLNAKQDKVDVSIVSPMPNTVVGALNYLEGAKQDELVSGTNIKTINSQSLLGAGNIQISGEPEAYIKSASVSGNTLTLTKQDDTDISFTPTGQEGGITDVKVNGTSVVTEGVANISIPADAQLVYDMTLNPSTQSVTINNPNYFQRIKDYIDENDKYPVIYGVVHIPTLPDLVILCKDITNDEDAMIITGYVTNFGGNYNTTNIIEITTTATTQIAVYDKNKSVNDTAPRITKVEITDNSIFFEDASGHDNTYTPTFNNLPDKPTMSDYQTVSGLDNAVSALGYLKEEDLPTIPTKTSELTNDSGFITENDIPTIPTKTSDLTNDSGFITSAYHDDTKQDVISDLATIRSGASAGATALQPNQTTQTLIFTMEDDTEVTVEVYVKENTNGNSSKKR